MQHLAIVVLGIETLAKLGDELAHSLGAVLPQCVLHDLTQAGVFGPGLDDLGRGQS